MAKKKSNSTTANRQSEELNQEKVSTVNDSHDELRLKVAEIDGLSETVRNLKSLNSVLVKQAHEMRVERSTLTSASKVLEEENAKLAVEKEEVEDVVVRMELEKNVMVVVFGERVGEMLKCGVLLVDEKEEVERKLESMESDVEVLKVEKESLEKERDVLKAEVGELKEKVGEAVERESEVVTVLDGLRKENEAAVREKIERGAVIECLEKENNVLNVSLSKVLGENGSLKELIDSLVSEKRGIELERNEKLTFLEGLRKENEDIAREKFERDLVIESLEKENNLLNARLNEALEGNEKLKEQIGSLVNEKHEIELERNEKLTIVEGLDKEVCGLRETVLGLQAEVDKLRTIVFELEKCNDELVQHRDGLSMEFAVLKELNEANVDQIKSLLFEKEILVRHVDETADDLEKSKRESERVITLMKAEIVELRQAHMTEVSEMQEIACQLKNKLEWSQQSCETLIEEKKKLATELEKLRVEIEASIAEKVRAQTNIQLEKKNVQNLTQNLVELEMKMQESVKEIHQLGKEKTKLIEVNEAVGVEVELLNKEIDLLHKELEVAKEESAKTMASSESANTMFDNVLHMLRKTTKELRASNDLLTKDDQSPVLLTNGVESFMSEMEAIKNVFHSKESTVSGMKKELEMMKHSVAEAQKRKSLWQVVTSATTIFAAASVAYVSRGH